MIKRISIKAASCLDMINAVNARISELDPGYVGASKCEEGEPIEAGIDPMMDNPVDEPVEYIQGAEGDVSEDYIDDMMQYVADEVTANLDSTCSWRVEGNDLIFIVAGLEDDSIEEYTCPLEDLTGDVDTDMNYILESVGI